MLFGYAILLKLESTMIQMHKHRLSNFLGVIVCLMMAAIYLDQAAVGQRSRRTVPVHKLYVDSLGENPTTEFLRRELCLKLSQSKRILLVDDRDAADIVLTGRAAWRSRGRLCSNLRPSYLNRNCLEAFDVDMTLHLVDQNGRSLWSGELKPRFWGSDNPFNNVVNQAANRVLKLMR